MTLAATPSRLAHQRDSRKAVSFFVRIALAEQGYKPWKYLQMPASQLFICLHLFSPICKYCNPFSSTSPPIRRRMTKQGPFITTKSYPNTLMFEEHCVPERVFAMILQICLLRFAAVRIFLAMLWTVHPMIDQHKTILGTVSTMTVAGGIWT